MSHYSDSTIPRSWHRSGGRFEVGHFIDGEGNNFWGVEVFQSGGKEYIAASDHDHGLFVFEYTGAE